MQNFALVGFLFQMIHCEMEKRRAVHDWWNGITAGEDRLRCAFPLRCAAPAALAYRYRRTPVRRRRGGGIRVVGKPTSSSAGSAAQPLRAHTGKHRQQPSSHISLAAMLRGTARSAAGFAAFSLAIDYVVDTFF